MSSFTFEPNNSYYEKQRVLQSLVGTPSIISQTKPKRHKKQFHNFDIERLDLLSGCVEDINEYIDALKNSNTIHTQSSDYALLPVILGVVEKKNDNTAQVYNILQKFHGLCLEAFSDQDIVLNDQKPDFIADLVLTKSSNPLLFWCLLISTAFRPALATKYVAQAKYISDVESSCRKNQQLPFGAELVESQSNPRFIKLMTQIALNHSINLSTRIKIIMKYNISPPNSAMSGSKIPPSLDAKSYFVAYLFEKQANDYLKRFGALSHPEKCVVAEKNVELLDLTAVLGSIHIPYTTIQSTVEYLIYHVISTRKLYNTTGSGSSNSYKPVLAPILSDLLCAISEMMRRCLALPPNVLGTNEVLSEEEISKYMAKFFEKFSSGRAYQQFPTSTIQAIFKAGKIPITFSTQLNSQHHFASLIFYAKLYRVIDFVQVLEGLPNSQQEAVLSKLKRSPNDASYLRSILKGSRPKVQYEDTMEFSISNQGLVSSLFIKLPTHVPVVFLQAPTDATSTASLNIAKEYFSAIVDAVSRPSVHYLRDEQVQESTIKLQQIALPHPNSYPALKLLDHSSVPNPALYVNRRGKQLPVPTEDEIKESFVKYQDAIQKHNFKTCSVNPILEKFPIIIGADSESTDSTGRVSLLQLYVGEVCFFVDMDRYSVELDSVLSIILNHSATLVVGVSFDGDLKLLGASVDGILGKQHINTFRKQVNIFDLSTAACFVASLKNPPQTQSVSNDAECETDMVAQESNAMTCLDRNDEDESVTSPTPLSPSTSTSTSISTSIPSPTSHTNQPLGLRVMVKNAMGLDLFKGITISNWSERPLAPCKVSYAAIDAWVQIPILNSICEGLSNEEIVNLLQKYLQVKNPLIHRGKVVDEEQRKHISM